ncbi:structure-specific endonuclease subunit slx1 [Magnolia sinica]|uniref:structure-specific endonuclease subunit slx1 n=1 Tax=Magnolia sinica TaxID=86752 RepID=UPI00265B5435|nr:structure-specific endonuclease subunit slx1 [Magnolia sinica]
MGKTTSTSTSWLVYLIVSSRIRKTYVGVTTNFPRRLKQHNGECKGGAKASRAGRPWACACLVHGFKGRSEACVFESKWKSFSRTMTRKRKTDDTSKQVDTESSLPLLLHRKAALDRVKASVDCSHLEIDWQLDYSSFD